MLPITVTQANVTYDNAFSEKFAWIASWAGGIRRAKLLKDDNPTLVDQLEWKRVPLPMDDQFELITCGAFDSNGDSTYIDVKNKNIIGINNREIKMISTNFCYGGEEIYEIENLKN